MSSAHNGTPSTTTITLQGWAGRQFTGTVTSNSNTGTFTFTYRDGDTCVYIGEYSNGMFNGKGLLKWSDGGSYECEWRDSMKHGVGVDTFPSGGRQLNEYEHDRRTRIISEGVCCTLLFNADVINKN